MVSSRPFAGLRIQTNVLLKPYTTFKIGGPARYFAEIVTPQDLEQALAFARAERVKVFVLGGGSNVLISDRGFDGLVLHPVNDGLQVASENAETVTLRVNAAETWDRVVAHAVERGWWGIENLSHIPGQAGAGLVQNIGAYGAEIADVFESAEVMELATEEVNTLGIEDCGLAYRRSIFNASRKGQFFIFGLTLKLTKQGRPKLDYPDVRTYFYQRGIERPTLDEIRHAIITIRDRKFPFPREEKGGNVGSFFKNLLLSKAEYEALEHNVAKNFSAGDLSKLQAIKRKFPATGRIKIPTAFLMEICDLKRSEVGGAKVNESQPLVLLNQGGATADNVLKLAGHVRRTIHGRTGMTVEIEPELVGFAQDEVAGYLSLPSS
ncbi:MAG TPA: UDP-N-acetylmuramate dehydrogenase [Terriglobia bacterium]|nr:UDP-N-acetylmuramate dehydrogenase [Terriglobia bacterium]